MCRSLLQSSIQLQEQLYEKISYLSSLMAIRGIQVQSSSSSSSVKFDFAGKKGLNSPWFDLRTIQIVWIQREYNFETLAALGS